MGIHEAEARGVKVHAERERTQRRGVGIEILRRDRDGDLSARGRDVRRIAGVERLEEEQFQLRAGGHLGAHGTGRCKQQQAAE